jgi:hypothetical protein
MKQLIGAALCVLLMGGAAAADSGKDKAGRGKPVAAGGRGDTHAHASASIHFEAQHVRAMRGHYASQVRQLPPGLQKKYARTGQLPPGWQKKMKPLPAAVERDLPRLPAGYGRGVIDGHAVIYNSRSGLIVDVAVLF